MGVPGMLTKIVDKIKGLGDIDLGLPDAFNLVGILKMIAKTCGKLLGAIPLPKPPSLSPADAIQKIMDKIDGMECPSMPSGMPSLPEMLSRLKEDAVNLGSDLPRPPVSLPGKKVLQSCIDILTSVKIPKPDIDFGVHFGVKLPGLPSAPKVQMGEGPKKNEYLEIRAKPILPKRVSGASRFVCLEIAYVIQAGARCYRRGYTGSVTTGDIDVLTSAGSSIYNKIGGLLPGSTKKAPSKPSGKGAAPVDEDGDEA